MSGDRFPLAPMSGGILVLTVLLLAMPVGLLFAAAWTGSPIALVPAGLFSLIHLLVWLYFRPTRFELTQDALRIVWPVRRLTVPFSGVTGVERLTRQEFRARYGWGMRVGAGGLWGGFGLIVTRKGTLRFYISRLDGHVLVHNRTTRALLITPSDPEVFAQILQERSSR